MKLRRLIVIILTVCMIVTYMPITGYAYADETGNDQETGSEAIGSADVSMPSNDGSDESADNPDTEEKAAIRALNGEAQREALDEYLNSETAENDIIEAESGLDYNTYDLGEDMRAKVFFSYPVRYEDINGDFAKIEPELVALDKKDSANGSSLKDYAYENKSGEYKTYIPSELSSDTPILLENDTYTFTMAPTSHDIADADVSVEDVKATYGSDEDSIKLEYISQNDGIKENIILNERPASNEITFKLTYDNMTYSLNPTDNGITFYDEETDEIVMAIESPFMNDATGEAYSEDLEYEMIDPEEGDSTYTLKLKISDKYLDDPDRVYPITIDPTATWVGTSEMRDSYVFSGSASTNYYSSSATTMKAGHASSGTYRTYIHILNLKNELIGANISSASFDIYETGGGNSGYYARIYRITEDWTNSTVTWSNKPDIASGYIDSVKTNGTANHKMTYDVTSWVKKVVNEDVHNYGLCLRNRTETGTTYTEFYGTRTGTTSRRPKLTVVYENDKPTQATKVRTDGPYARGKKVYVSWEGVNANKLDCIQYKIAKLNDAGEIIDANYVSYTSIGSKASSGRHSIPGSANFPKGYYRVYIRGLSKMGITGKYNSAKFRIEEKPSTPSSVTLNSYSIYTGDSITVSWTGLTGNLLSEAQYKIAKLNSSGGISNSNYIPYTKLKSNPSASDSATITGKIKDPGTYKIYVRGANSSGIVGDACISDIITVTKDNSPEIGSITLSKGNTTIDQTGYIQSGNITVNVTGITDDRSLSGKKGIYRLLKDGNVIETDDDIDLTASGNTYTASFGLSQSVFTSSGAYTVEFSVTDLGENTGSNTAALLIDDEEPYLSIDIADLPQEGMLNIPFYATDSHSGIDSIDLKLYHGSENDLGSFVMDLANNITDEKTVTFDAGTLTNGPYTLKLTAADNAGNSAVLYRDFEVYNRVPKPEIAVSVINSGDDLRVDWEYDTAPSDLDQLEYSLNSGSWVTVSTGNQYQGYFTVDISNLTGTNSIRLRGVDSNDVEGDAVRKDFTIDAGVPTVAITSFSRGILKGTVNDSNLKKWELFIKASNANDSTYVKIEEGTNTAVNGRICFVDLSGGPYTNGSSYTFKLTACDTADNESEATFQFTYSSTAQTASYQSTSDRVKRSLGQSYSSDSFLVLANEDNEITLDISGETELTNISWYLNNSLIGTGRTLTHELTGTELTGSNEVSFKAEDSLGNRVYSRDLYIDSDEEWYDFGTPSSGRIVQEVELSEEAVAIRLDLPDESLVSYYVKAGSGQYQSVSSGDLIYISDLDNDIIKSDTFTLKAEGPNRTLQDLYDFSVLPTACSDESFTVTTSPMEAYWPGSFRAIDKINYKTYLYWDVPETLPNDISYEVHRSTVPDFEPSINTLVEGDIREGYWCDINVNYGTELYYKVRAVKKVNGHVTDASSYTACMMSTAIDRNEYEKHLGHKEYWGYAEVKTPNGTGYIEKHDLNFFYSANDANVPNESLPFSFTRVYNSNATSKSSLGYGWTHSYDLELLKLKGDEDIESGILALRDGQGTIYTFSWKDDRYISSMGRYLTLKEETIPHTYSVTVSGIQKQFSFDSNYTMFSRDGMKSYFDENGKLMLIEEANSNILIFSYDTQRGMLETITTGRGIEIGFTYYDGDNGTDALTLKELRLPDGSKTVYSYTGASRLSTVKQYPVSPANQNDCITYGYTYSNKKMVGLTDGSGNAYSLSYGTSPKTVTFSYPEIQSQPVESMRVTKGEDFAVTERLVGGSAVSHEEDFFDSFGQVTEHRKYTGEAYVSETYTYVNNLIATETSEQVYDILELSDDGNSGVISKGSKSVTISHEYDGNDNSTGDSYDTINDKVSVTDYSYASTGTTEWNDYLPTETSETIDGVTISHESSEYDASGNLTENRDYIDHELTEYEYADGTGNIPKGTLVSEDIWIMNDSGQKAGLISSMSSTVSYSGDSKTETVTNDSGDTRTVESTTYDQMGRVTQMTIFTYSDYGTSEQKITKESHTYTYDGYGRETSETTTTSKVNGNLNDISGTVATTSSSKSYYPNGALASETDEKGITSAYSYDELNRLVSTTVSKGNLTQTTTTSYSYGPVTVHDGRRDSISYSNCLITTESDNGLETHMTYQDGQGRMVREINGGVITDYVYDLSGNRIIEFLVTEKAQDIQDEEGITTYSLYNEEGTVYGTVTDPGWDDTFVITETSVIEVNYFDDRGNISQTRDALGNVTEYGYDLENRLSSVTLPDTSSNVTTFSYSETSNNSGDYTSTVTMTDAMGSNSVEVSDANGNVVSISDNGRQNENITPIETQFEYDGSGRVTKETKASGEYITYSYDSMGRLTERSEYTSSGTELTRTTYTYVGTTENIQSMSDYRIENGSPVLYHYEEFNYDNLGRMTSKAEVNDTSLISNISDYRITYSYDIHDNIISIAYGSAIPTEVSSINYTYSGERLTGVSAVIDNVEYALKAYTYTDWGAVDTVRDYYDFKVSGTSKYVDLNYGYDHLTNVSQMVYTKEDDTVLESHSYSYDKAGRILTEENSSSLNDLNEIRRFGYDSLGRLVSSDIKDIVEESGVITEENKLVTEYSYDKVGNRVEKTENGINTSYIYNGLNQLTSETTDGETLSYGYDDNGNQISVTGTVNGETVSKSLTYTPGGMMATYSDGEKAQANTYTGEGRRVTKAEGTSLQSIADITNYYYQERSVLYTTDEDNEVKAFNLLNFSDIFGTERPDGSDKNYYYYLNDVRGSKTNLIDDAAGQVISYWYNDFGEVSEERNEDYEEFVNEVQYTGAIYDSSTGLFYLNARFYDPVTGRFISQDTYRGEKDEPDTWHLYNYCHNDPMNYLDSSGHEEYEWPSWVPKWVRKWAGTIPTKANHYGRNVKNINLPENESDAISKNYKRAKFGEENCHQFSIKDKILKRNLKYVSSGGHKEVIFDYTGKNIITDDRDIGTYNLGIGRKNHFFKDVLPWFKWGNTSNDSTTRKKRIDVFCQGCVLVVTKKVLNYLLNHYM